MTLPMPTKGFGWTVFIQRVNLCVTAPARQQPDSLRSKPHDDPTPRPHHERGHRPHGAEPASDPLDRRDPRPGRRGACQRRSRDARSDPGRARRRQGRGAGETLQCRALDHRSRQGAGRHQRQRVLRCRDHAGAAVAADQSHQRRQACLLREADRDQPRRSHGGGEACEFRRASSTARCRTSCSCRG